MANKFHGNVKANVADVSIPVELRTLGTSVETTGVVHGSVDVSYWRQGAALVTQTGLSGTHTNLNDGHIDWYWKEVSATNAPGVYRLDVPDAVFAAGAEWVTISVVVSGSFVYSVCYAIETAGSSELQVSLPNQIAPGAANGLQICGSNAATTYATLTVSGTTTLTGAVSLGSTLGVSGVTTLGTVNTGNVTFNNLTVTGTITSANVTFTGATTLNTLTVSGNTSLAAVATSGTVTFNAFTVTGAMTVNGTSKLIDATTRLYDTLELDGSVYRFTTNALENAPSGGGGGLTAEAVRIEMDANSTKLANLNATISSRMATFTVPGSFAAADFTRLDVAVSTRNATAPPSAATIATAVWDKDVSGYATINLAGTLLKAIDVGTAYLITNQDAGFQALNASITGEADSIQTVTNKLDTMLESDGPVYRFTTNALEQGPSGAGGGGTATLENQLAILEQLGGANVTVTSPLTEDGSVINVVEGDSYYHADGRALNFTFSGVPSLTGGSFSFKVASASLTVAATVTSATTLRVELSEANTLTLAPGKATFHVDGTLSNGHHLTLVVGSVFVKQNQ